MSSIIASSGVVIFTGDDNNDEYGTMGEAFREKRPGSDWSAPMEIEGKVLAKLRKSIQQFQLGDGGGPGYLIAWNRQTILAVEFV